MSREFGKTLGHAGIYSIGIILSRAVSFIMLPIYTRYLTPADYGVLEILEITVDIVSVIAGIGVLQGLSKFYYQYDTDEKKKELVSTVLFLVGGFYLIACLGGVASSSAISDHVFGSRKYALFVLISFVNLFFMVLLHTNMSYLRTRQKSVMFIAVSFVDLLFKVGLNILFVVHLRMGVLGILLSSLISFSLLSAMMTTYTLYHVGLRFSRTVAAQQIRFGAPFVLEGIAAFINTYSDRFFLNHYTNLATVGLYSFGYKFGFLLMWFPVTPLMNIWMAQRFELVQKEGYEKVFNQFLNWFSIVTLAVALFIALTVRDALKVIAGQAFWEAYSIVPVILLAYFFQACTGFFNFGIFHTGKTKHVAYGTLLAAAVILVLSFLLIPRYGAQGAAWSTLIAFFVRLSYFYVASQSLFRIRYELMKPILTTTLAVFIYLIYYFGIRIVPALNQIYYSSFMVISLFLLFLGMLGILNIVSGEERRTIFRFVKTPIKSFVEIRNQSK